MKEEKKHLLQLCANIYKMQNLFDSSLPSDPYFWNPAFDVVAVFFVQSLNILRIRLLEKLVPVDF